MLSQAQIKEEVLYNSDEIMYTKEQIKEIIPHRDPFLMIDEILHCGTYAVGERVIARKYIRTDDEVFKGHFPDEPVYPGVLVIESLAQAGAFMLLSQEEFKGRIAYFGGADKVKFRQMVKPGDTLTLVVQLISDKKRIGKCIGKAYLNGKVCCSGELTFIVG